MFQLSEQQIDLIHGRLQKQGLKSTKLEQDLLDHICCDMEQRMAEGMEFESAYRESMRVIIPNGAKEIEFELFFIMSFNKQVSMKKFIFLTGFVATLLLSTGLMFKTLNWMGTHVLLLLGFSILLLAMAAIAIHAVRFMRHQSTSFWVRTVAGISSLSLIGLGFMFRIGRLPGADVMYGLGTIIFNFVFLPLFFYHIYKNGFVKTHSNEAA